MKKIIAAAAIFAACEALCASVWPQSGTGEKVPAEIAVGAIYGEKADTSVTPKAIPNTLMSDTVPMTAEKANRPEYDAPTEILAKIFEPVPTASQQAAVAAATAVITDNPDPYHTDVYPENVYSEEYLYNADGNLIGENYHLSHHLRFRHHLDRRSRLL